MLIAFLTFICVVAFGGTFLTYAFFWYETVNRQTSGGGDQDDYDWKILQSLAKGMLSSVASLVLIIFSHPFGYWRRLWESPLDTNCPLPPVILVHGLYHNPSGWIAYRRWLKRAGFTNIYALGYTSWGTSFQKILPKLESFIKEVNRKYPDKPVILIGHSLGGLLCRAYVEGSPDPVNVAAVVTLGSPHQGSKLAAVGIGALAQSLIFRGPLIRELEQKRKPVSVPNLVAYSPIDNMVLPIEALKMPYKGWNHHRTPPMSHVAMLYHKPTAKLIIEFLQAACRPVTGEQEKP